MEILSQSEINEALSQPEYSNIRKNAYAFFDKIGKINFGNINELKKSFPSADLIQGERFIFNLSKNRYRLIVDISFKHKWLTFVDLLTHAEYSKLSKDDILRL
jgi:mRNA interferase HigB